MAVPNSDLPHDDQPIGQGGAPSKGPAQVSTGGTPRSGAPSPTHTNRPIPLASRASDEFPDEDDDDDETEGEAGDLREVMKNAPAWLVSTVFHMVLLIALGMLVVGSVEQAAELDIEAGYTEDLGTQLEDPSVTVSETNLEELVTEPLITTTELPAVVDPLVAPPMLEALDLLPVPNAERMVTSSTSAPNIALALSGRRDGSRQALLKKYGGTKGTEAAVELGLEWLAKQQQADGSWSLRGPYPDVARNENTAAATAMALLAFQGHGDTHRTGKYEDVVSNGWKALLKMQLKDGRFAGKMDAPLQQLYTHAQGTIAVCELYGMTGDSAFRSPATRAIAYCVASQDKAKGGWRYVPGQDSDTSVTGWFMMALQSARMAKLNVPNDTLLGISRYLDSAALNDGRQYGYWGTVNVSSAMSAEGLLCRQYLGWPRDEPRLVEGVSALLKDPVSYDTAGSVNVYYWYYGTQAAHHMEGQIWKEWNDVMRKEVPANQVQEGPQAGSWDPQADNWGFEGGRLFVTCLSIYNLEVYYRHLPIYARLGTDSAPPPIVAPDTTNADVTDAPPAEGEKNAPGQSDPEKASDGVPQADRIRLDAADAP